MILQVPIFQKMSEVLVFFPPEDFVSLADVLSPPLRVSLNASCNHTEEQPSIPGIDKRDLVIDLTEDELHELKAIKNDKERASRRREMKKRHIEKEKTMRLTLLKQIRDKKHAKRKERRTQ